MNPFVICLSGRIGSGKTSVSIALAAARNAATASFGAFVRTVAIARGLDANRREVLQDLGANLITEHGHEWLCREVVAAANWKQDRDLVVDGVRHVDVFDAIKRISAPTTTLLIYLQLESEMELAVRTGSRGILPDARARLEQHSTEHDVIQALPSLADLVVSAEAPVERIVGAIDAFLINRNRACQLGG